MLKNMIEKNWVFVFLLGLNNELDEIWDRILGNEILPSTLKVFLKVQRKEMWNQDLVNLSFDDNKTRFRTNDYILSVIRQDDFQSGNHKDKSSKWEIMKKKTTLKRSVFQDPSFIRSLCKVVGALGF